LQVPVPQQREEHLLLKHRLGAASGEFSFPPQVQKFFGIGNIGQIEQLEETINCVAVGKIVEC